MNEHVMIESDGDGDGVIVHLPGFAYGGVALGASSVWLEYQHLRELRDAIIAFLGADQ